MRRSLRFSLLTTALLAALTLAACKREQPAAEPPAVAPAPAAVDTLPAITLTDVIERDPRYLVGITYPPLANKYPGLAHALKQYTDAARADLDEALGAEEAGGHERPQAERPPVMYELSLEYRPVADTDRFAAIAAAGSLFTGGAHGNPLVGRWLWLPQRNEMLTAQKLVPQADGWNDIARYVREQLHAELAQRIEADDLEPAIRAEVLRSGRRMIDEGTTATADNFAEFEPVPGPDGRLIALRFVFPPYQVGPYSDGEQSVEVPAAVLLPKIAPEYRDLFVAD